MTKEEAIEFIAQSVKSDVDMAKVADAIKALEQEPNEVCDWFKQYIDIPSNTVLIEFSDGTSKRVKRGWYLANIENDLRRMMNVQIERESYEDAIKPNQEPRWIPVSERLPTKEEYIANNGLFIVTDGNRTYAEYFDVYNSMKYFGEPTMNGFRVDRCVSAWMPLPDAYREA